MHTERLKITGMSCGDCSTKVAQALKAVAGVADVNVSLSAAKATVRYDERQTSIEQLKSAVKEAGYGVDGATGNPHGKGGGCCG